MEKEIKYPIDRADFRSIREEGFLYVDKTEFVYKLAHRGKYFFLARPRRFGKSLLLNTLAEYFRGNKELFHGLAIERLQPGEWESYPVMRFNLSTTAYPEPTTLVNHLNRILSGIEEEFQLEKSSKEYEGKFEYLIKRVKEKTGKKVVILIDEYDAPLSSTIDRGELQEVYRNQLQGFYSVLKGVEEHIQFCMLTGVTRYGKVSVFSGLNNLKDITFSDDYAAVCGITSRELTEYYGQGVERLARTKGISAEEAYGLLQEFYDGYHFSESLTDIYNPFSINNAFYDNKIDDYWCQSGTPTLLARSLMQNDYDISEFDEKLVDISQLSDLSMFTTRPLPLFYQTGYLTLKSYEKEDKLFTVGYPNKEVERGILGNVLGVYTSRERVNTAFIYDLEDAFVNGKPEESVRLLSSFLSGIPLKLREDVKRYENYYHTIFYCIVKLMGLDIHAEYATSEGYIDILVTTADYIYVIELKETGSAEDAIRQIDEKHYCAPFASDSRKIYKIGLGFSKETGTITSSVII